MIDPLCDVLLFQAAHRKILWRRIQAIGKPHDNAAVNDKLIHTGRPRLIMRRRKFIFNKECGRLFVGCVCTCVETGRKNNVILEQLYSAWFLSSLLKVLRKGYYVFWFVRACDLGESVHFWGWQNMIETKLMLLFLYTHASSW